MQHHSNALIHWNFVYFLYCFRVQRKCSLFQYHKVPFFSLATSRFGKFKEEGSGRPAHSGNEQKHSNSIHTKKLNPLNRDIEKCEQKYSGSGLVCSRKKHKIASFRSEPAYPYSGKQQAKGPCSHPQLPFLQNIRCPHRSPAWSCLGYMTFH